MHNRAKQHDSQNQQAFSFTVSSRLSGPAILDKKPLRELGRKNKLGDTFRCNHEGQVTHFRYNHSDRSYSFGYDSKGVVTTINSSDGWSWTRVCEPGFDGWLVRNYFDSWCVPASDCSALNVTEEGVQVAGANTLLMGLPVRV
jgi:hypothetical protein